MSVLCKTFLFPICNPILMLRLSLKKREIYIRKLNPLSSGSKRKEERKEKENKNKKNIPTRNLDSNLN